MIRAGLSGLNSDIAPGLSVKKPVILESGSGFYLRAGTADEYTQLVINNKWAVLEYTVNDTIKKTIPLWDGK